MNRVVLLAGIPIAVVLTGILALALGSDPQKIESPLVGRPAPAFALRDITSGRVIDVQQLRGKPVVINFWATWCRPCYEEHPVLVENARLLSPGVQFVGVVFDDTEANINRFLRERGLAYPTLVDEKGKTAIAYGVGGVPETFFIDPAGTIVAKFDGPLTSEALQANVQRAMR
jgi:cytochrome c biogenesis protein CcmG, thiol:disulfide interchange protein DsbE